MMIFLCSCVFFVSITSTLLSKNIIKNAKSRNAVCNDGSDGVFYIRRNESSTRWMMFLMGGGGCYNIESCKDRMKNAPYLMSNKLTKDTEDLYGIFSNDCQLNPAFCLANLVFVYYCTSDWHSGNNDASETTGNFTFRGKIIPQAVVEDLFDLHGLGDATEFYLSGLSAGGVGALSNADTIGGMVEKQIPSVEYGVISDSGWFLDGTGLNKWPCTSQGVCLYETRMKSGFGPEFWNIEPLEGCGKHYPANEIWKCLVGYHLYPHIKARTMVAINVYDSWLSGQDGIPKRLKDMNETEIAWVNKRGDFTEETMKTVLHQKNVWAVGCFFHTLIANDHTYFQLKNNDGVTLADAVNKFVNGDSPTSYDECDEKKVGACDANCVDLRLL